MIISRIIEEKKTKKRQRQSDKNICPWLKTSHTNNTQCQSSQHTPVNVPVLTHGFLHLTTTVRSLLTPASQKQTDYILGGDQTHWVTNHN